MPKIVVIYVNCLNFHPVMVHSHQSS